MNARESAVYIKRILAREDASKEMESQLRLLAERLYLQLPTCVITQRAPDGSISSICVSDVIYDTTLNCINGIAGSAKNEKPGRCG